MLIDNADKCFCSSKKVPAKVPIKTFLYKSVLTVTSVGPALIHLAVSLTVGKSVVVMLWCNDGFVIEEELLKNVDTKGFHKMLNCSFKPELTNIKWTERRIGDIKCFIHLFLPHNTTERFSSSSSFRWRSRGYLVVISCTNNRVNVLYQCWTFVVTLKYTQHHIETVVWQTWQQDSRNTEVMNPKRLRCSSHLLQIAL